MTDRATASLPARNFDKTAAFYETLGFSVRFKDEGWMTLNCGPLELEFFPMPKLDPKMSWFSTCLRVDDLDALYAEFQEAGLSKNCNAAPRISPPKTENCGLRMSRWSILTAAFFDASTIDPRVKPDHPSRGNGPIGLLAVQSIF